MIPEHELNKAIELAKKYNIGQLFLVGSALYKKAEDVNDYDFAIRDYPPGIFFRFYGSLLMAMSKNVDLIDLSGETTKFTEIILKEGRLIYDKRAA